MDKVVEGNFEDNRKKNQHKAIVVNLNRYLALCLNRTDDMYTVTTNINGQDAFTRPAAHDDLSFFSAAGRMQHELRTMIGRYEPWRVWDNAMFVSDMAAPADEVEVGFTEKYPVPLWDRFMRRTHVLVNLIRDSLDQHFGGEIVVWTLPRDDDDSLSIQARRTHPADGKESSSLVIVFVLSAANDWSVVELGLRTENDGWIALIDNLYLDDRKDIQMQAEALAGVLCMDKHEDQINIMQHLAGSAGL